MNALLDTAPDLVHGGASAELTVDLDAIAANTAVLARHARGELMAVVKADGFGHGAVDVARTALAHGASWLGVTTLDEALALRAAGLSAPVLSWLNAPDGGLARGPAAGIDLAVPSLAHLRAVEGCHTPGGAAARIHLQLDVGLAREGASATEWELLCAAARAAERRGRVRVVGLMGHLPCADTPGHPADASARAAYARGVRVARAAGLRPPHRHLAATAATLHDPAAHHTLVRVGAGLVGIDPAGHVPLRRAMTLTAPVVSVRKVASGTGVGYGHTWVAPYATTLGLVAAGYADGLPRAASGHAALVVGGRRRPIVGRISMDQVVVDLGPGSSVVPSEVATLVGTTPGAPTTADWARWSATLEHEVVVGLGCTTARVRRTVLGGPR